MDDLQTAAIANTFASYLFATLGETNFRIMVATNATPEYSVCCASHNYCDSNVAMLEAMAAHGHPMPDSESAHLEAWTDRVNAAWDHARAASFPAMLEAMKRVWSLTALNARTDDQSVTMADGRTATWTLDRDHTGHLPRSVKRWYLRCDDCGSEIEGAPRCECIDDL